MPNTAIGILSRVRVQASLLANLKLNAGNFLLMQESGLEDSFANRSVSITTVMRARHHTQHLIDFEDSILVRQGHPLLMLSFIQLEQSIGSKSLLNDVLIREAAKLIDVCLRHH